jgi:predicted TIM-barrel fold metal-dependent hydrolase
VVAERALSDDVDIAVLLCTYAIDSMHNPDHAVALARAVNDWQIEHWLEKEPRFRASIVVPSQLPALAAAEINRVADHPGFVQVALPVRSQHPYGSRLYEPMWEAIARHDLVAGVHFGGAPGNPPTAVGWPSYFVEEYIGMAAVFASQLTSMVVEGLFDRFESLRVTLLESGVSWLTAQLWRLDKEWKQLRITVPWVRRPPSSYIRDHVRLTTEPWDVPADDQRSREVLEHLGSEEILLYGSAYPHQPVGTAARMLDGLDERMSRKVSCDNAVGWYRL